MKKTRKTTMTTDSAGPAYPNREHKNADRAARRRALAALNAITAEAERLRQKLQEADNPLSSLDSDDTRTMDGKVHDLTAEFAVIGALRDVREWHAADLAEAGKGAEDGFRGGFLAGRETRTEPGGAE
jgi:hypothetical protein